MKIKLNDKIFCCEPFFIKASKIGLHRVHTFEKAIVVNVHLDYPVLISVLMNNYNDPFKINIDQFNLHFKPIEDLENEGFIKESEMTI